MVPRRHQFKPLGKGILFLRGSAPGLILCIAAFVMNMNVHTSLQQRPAASQGRIVSCHMETAAISSSAQYPIDVCRPTVQFQTASGQKIVFVSSYTWGGFHQGDNLPVQYQSDRPQEALLLSDGLWADVKIISSLGLLLLLLPLLYWISSLWCKRSRGES